jgi:hypothetical protein
MNQPHFYRLRKEAVGKDWGARNYDGDMRKGLLKARPPRRQ